MTDNITLPRATAQQALEALQNCANGEDDVLLTRDALAALRTALEQQAEPVYKDSTSHLHVGDSAFESWFQAQPFATQTGIKQISRDSYAAGMGDPLVVAAPQQQAEPVGSLSVRYYRGCKSMTNTDFDYNGDLPEGDYELYTAPPQRKPMTCQWLLEDDDFMPDTYRSACGELWSFIDGGWKDNRVRYCHGCGGKVIEAAHNIKEGT